MNVGEIVIGAKLDTKDFTAQISTLEKEVAYYEKSLQDTMNMKAYKGQEQDVEDLSNALEKAKNKLSGLYKQQEKINKEGFKETTIDVNKVQKGTNNVIKSISKWALAIIGIRSIYAGIRSTINSVSQYNEQVATDLEYIRYVIAQALTPVVKYLVSLLATLMNYVGYIAKAWLGVDIYSKASAKNFKNARTEAQKMQKSLAGFDEANTLSSNSANGNSGTPSFSLGGMSDQDAPKWLKWIKDNGKEVASILVGIASALVLVKLGLNPIVAIIGGALFVNFFKVFTGIINYVKDLLDFIKDPSWEKAYQLTLDGYDSLGLIGDLLEKLFKTLFKNSKEFKSLFTGFIDGAKTTFNNFTTFIELKFALIYTIMKMPFEMMYNVIKNLVNYGIEQFKTMATFIGQIFSGDFGGAFNSFKQGWKNTFDFVENAWKGTINVLISAFNTLIKGINKFEISVPKWVPTIGGNSWKPNIKTIPKLEKGGLVNNPGKGVMMGNYIAGEAGREAVLPLSDPMALEMIGEAIGKYITINANITNSMDGRVISRELQKVQSNSNFAFNR